LSEGSEGQMAIKLTDLPHEDLFVGPNNGCPGCGVAIALRQATKVLGPRTMVTIPASCAATIGGSNLATAWKIPFFHALFECSAAVASGIKAGLERQGKKDVVVVSWAGDAGSADIGFQALSGAAERNEDILHVCYDNEVAMNTGGQASSSSPESVFTTLTPAGKPTGKKDMLAIMAAHRVPYVASASIGYPEDFVNKVATARKVKGFRYLHVLAPCFRGWQIPAARTVEMARLAVDSGLWPLYELVDGKKRVTVEPARRVPVKDYIRPQGRFAPLSDHDLEAIQRQVEAGQGCFGAKW